MILRLFLEEQEIILLLQEELLELIQGIDLLMNLHQNPTSRPSSSTNPPTSIKSLREYSTPSNSNLATLPCASDGKVDFELKPSLINMVRAIAFNGNPSEDANAHLLNFLEICGTISIKGIRQDVIQLYLFPFSLQEKAKHWFYHNLVKFDTWENVQTTSSPTSSRLVRLIFFVVKFLTFNRKTKNLSLKHGSACKNMFKHVRTMGCNFGY